MFTTIPLLAYDDFPGFKNYHIANSYRKSILEEVWSKEPDALNRTISSRFRDYDTNVSDWIFNYWQFAKGLYCQKWSGFGVNICMDNKKTASIIRKQKRHIVCLSEPSNNDFQKIQKEMKNAFESILPEPCEYEKRGAIGNR